ncbi:MAG: hypothetical protein Roseis2KO_52040 [Roseivirga sp.]
MELTEQQQMAMLAYESFIRRASEINMPFMLKGSYVTRQYFPEGVPRIPADLDWVYMHHIDEPNTANNIFSQWITLVTEHTTDDSVQFRSFSENAFWRMMDYAMADDFPTVNTDIRCWVNGVQFDFDLDISFNLEVNGAATSLEYRPLKGSSFLVPYTAPLHLQVAWKIHQTLVRPRMKDLFDLMYLVQHKDFDREILLQSFDALLKECLADEVNLSQLEDFLNYRLDKLFEKVSLTDTWNYWRLGRESENTWYFGRNDQASCITNANRLPVKLALFIDQFRQNMEAAGFCIDLLLEFPDEIAELYQEDNTPAEAEKESTPLSQESPIGSDKSNPENESGSWFTKLLKRLK